MTNPKTSELLRQLAEKADDLLEGMRRRVKCDPDIADYIAGFEPILAAHDAQLRDEVRAELRNDVIESVEKSILAHLGEDDSDDNCSVAEQLREWKDKIRSSLLAPNPACPKGHAVALRKERLAGLSIGEDVVRETKTIFETDDRASVCEECGEKYSGYDSNALNRQFFCCASCEDRYLRRPKIAKP